MGKETATSERGQEAVYMFELQIHTHTHTHTHTHIYIYIYIYSLYVEKSILWEKMFFFKLKVRLEDCAAKANNTDRHQTSATH